MTAVLAVEMFPLPLRDVQRHTTKVLSSFMTVSTRRAEALTIDTQNINHLSFLKVRDGGRASQAVIIIPMLDGFHKRSGDNNL
jgi:hypothetical protein